MPLICKALDCGVQKIQEVILEKLPKILNDIDKNEFQNMIYNRLVKIVMQTKNKKLKKKIMNFLIHLCDYFDSYFINNNFLDDIEKIIKSETTLNVCKNAFTLYEQIKSKVNDKSVRSKIIPSLLLMMCNGEISEDLFNKGERIINSYIEKIKEKRKAQFVEDMEIDSDSDKNIKRKPSKNTNNLNNFGSPVSVTRSKSNLSGNISLFEINSSEDSNFDFDDKSKNAKKEKNDKINKDKEKKVIFNNNNEGNLFDNLLDDGNNEAEIKNNDSSFDSTSTGKNKNKNQFENPNRKEFLSSLKLKKIEKQKKSEIKQKEEITKLNENKKNRWEEIESDDENTDELSKYISKEKSSEKNDEYDKKESKKSEKRKKWDEDEDEDNENYEDCMNFKKNESENINKEKKIDELLILNNDDSKDKNNKIYKYRS
jgi:hypothetical protein